jgi:hypothetical protein
MTESYRTPRGSQFSTGVVSPGWNSTLESTASYSKFRRFQVKTEETVAIPKR